MKTKQISKNLEDKLTASLKDLQNRMAEIDLQEKRIKIITEDVANGGGAVQYHYVNNICLSIEDGVLVEIKSCRKSETNPFGIRNVPFDNVEISKRLVEEIRKYGKK